MNGFVYQYPPIDDFMEYTKRRNLNRGYMKLDVWQRGMDLFELAFRLAGPVSDLSLIHI